MVVPGHHGGDLVQHLDGGGRALGGAGAQLALVVAAPGPQGAVGFQRHGEVGAGAGGHHVFHHGQGLAGVGDGVALQVGAGLLGLRAQLACLVAAPGPEGARLVHIDGVGQAGAQAEGLLRGAHVVGAHREDGAA